MLIPVNPCVNKRRLENHMEEWGFIPLSWIKNREVDSAIIVDDLDAFLSMTNYIVRRVGIEGDYSIIESDGYRARIHTKEFRSVPRGPVALINEPVKVLNAKGYLEFGIVTSVHWHLNNKHYLFYIAVHGNKRKRRYNEVDVDRVIIRSSLGV